MRRQLVAAIVLIAAVSASVALILAMASMGSSNSVELESSQMHGVSESINRFDAPSHPGPDSVGLQEAATYAFVRINQDRMACHRPVFTSFNVWSAKRQVQDGIVYTLELNMDVGQGYEGAGTAAYHVRVEQLLAGQEHPTVSNVHTPQSPLLAHYAINTLAPSPCADYEESSLSSLLHQPAHLINRNNDEKGAPSSWEASVYPQFDGLTTEEFIKTHMGFKLPPAHLLKQTAARTNKLSSLRAPATLPKAFDVRDQGPACKSFQVQDQGDCGSCFAFATATALSQRLCHASQFKFDVEISPQDILSCYSNNACEEGGVPLMVMDQMTTSGKVSTFCAPYTARDPARGGVCGEGVCNNGLRFHTRNQTLGWLAGSATEIQEEIMYSGSVVVGMAVHADFPMYKSGVYKVAPWAKNRVMGGHAVVVVGWGEDSQHGPYWLCMNSWSANWGENGGFFRIARGRDEAKLETYGAFFAEMDIPDVCPDTKCDHGGEIMQDCSCQCFHDWVGDTCHTCSRTCGANGMLKADTCECECFPGYEGKQCENKLRMKRSFTCGTAPAEFEWDLQSTRKVMVGSYIQVFPRGVQAWNADTNTWAESVTGPLPLCGSKDAWTSQHKYCNNKGVLMLPLLSPGSYDVYLVEFLGKNEFGAPKGFQRPKKIDPTVRVAPSCNDLLYTVEVMEDELEHRDAAKAQEHKAKISRQLARLNDAIEYMHSHPAPRSRPRVRAWPSVAYDVVHVFVNLPAPIVTGTIRICQAELSTTAFFHDSIPHSSEPATCADISEVTAHTDVLSFAASQLPAGEQILQLLGLDGVVLAESRVTIGHVKVHVTDVEPVAGGNGIKLHVSWSVSPSTVVSDKDWIGIFPQGADSYIASFSTASHTLAGTQHPQVSHGSATVVLEAGVDGAVPGREYYTAYMPAGQDDAAALAPFVWPLAQYSDQ